MLPEGVKDSFYGWLATRKDIGQIIVLENEKPNEQQKNQLSYTEFFGPSAVDGERVGFFPVN